MSLKLPVQVEYHQNWFPYHEPDDKWLPLVGGRGWTVIGHDSKYHLLPNELLALRQYSMGCFYLWGAEATRWQKMRVLALAYDNIVEAESRAKRPFIFRVDRRGKLRPVPIP